MTKCTYCGQRIHPDWGDICLCRTNKGEWKKPERLTYAFRARGNPSCGSCAGSGHVRVTCDGHDRNIVPCPCRGRVVV